MKKLLGLLFIVSILLFTTIKVNAEEVEDNTSTSSPDTEIEDEVNTEEPNLEEIIIEENQPSEMQKWFEENLGWLVGIPTGTVLAVLVEILSLANKSKKKKEEIAETQNQNKNGKEVLSTARELLTDTKQLAKNLETAVTNALTNIAETDSKINDRVVALTNELSTRLTVGLETLNKTLVLLENRITALEDVQEMVALHTKELVANGTAEEITKKIRG